MTNLSLWIMTVVVEAYEGFHSHKLMGEQEEHGGKSGEHSIQSGENFTSHENQHNEHGIY